MSEYMGSNQGCSIKLCYSLRNYISFKETTSTKAQVSSASSNAKIDKNIGVETLHKLPHNCT
jgi:hypothetical protein